MSNRVTWEAEDVVSVYSDMNALQRPEVTILRDFRDKLKDEKMLDIGVGGGRTTYHFARVAKEYIGIDYSISMIESCRNRLSSFPKNVSFEVCDVRDMGMFEDNFFGLTLFSFNGVDYVSHEDRLLAFQEMKRVTKRGGLVCFSTHNLQSLTGRPLLVWTANPAKLMWRILNYFCSLRNKKLKKFRSKSFKKLVENNKYVIVNNDYLGGRVITYYIKPEEQLKQLTDCGFSNIRIYSLNSGKEIINKSKIDRIRDGWLYYICEVT